MSTPDSLWEKQQEEARLGTFGGYSLRNVLQRSEDGKATVFPSRLCTATPLGNEFQAATKSRYYVVVRVAQVNDFKHILDMECELGSFYLYYNEASQCAGALDLVLHEETQEFKKKLLVATFVYLKSTKSPFPFDCPGGRQILASHPDVYWEFGTLTVRRPENLLGCRYLSLDDVRIKTNPKFEREIGQFRGSLALSEGLRRFGLLLDILRKSTVHLDVFAVSLANVDIEQVNALASVSCNWFVWKPCMTPCCQLTPFLVSQMTCPVGLHITIHCACLEHGDMFDESEEEKVFFASQALELTHHEHVRELRWNVECDETTEFSPEKFYTQIHNLGRLDSLAISIFTEKDCDVTRRVVESLTPPPSFSLRVATLYNRNDSSGNRRLLVPYVRSQPQLVKFDFSSWHEHPILAQKTEAQEQLRDDLGELARDNAWLGLIRSNHSVSLSAIVHGRSRRRAVLYFALQKRAAELTML